MDGIQREAYGDHASELRRWYAFDIPLTGDALERATTDVEAAIARAGLRVPEDISAVGYDGIPLAKMMIPSLTTYHQDTQAIGYWAADRLVSLIEHPKTTLPESILIPGSLLEGASVRRI